MQVSCLVPPDRVMVPSLPGSDTPDAALTGPATGGHADARRRDRVASARAACDRCGCPGACRLQGLLQTGRGGRDAGEAAAGPCHEGGAGRGWTRRGRRSCPAGSDFRSAQLPRRGDQGCAAVLPSGAAVPCPGARRWPARGRLSRRAAGSAGPCRSRGRPPADRHGRWLPPRRPPQPDWCYRVVPGSVGDALGPGTTRTHDGVLGCEPAQAARCPDADRDHAALRCCVPAHIARLCSARFRGLARHVQIR